MQVELLLIDHNFDHVYGKPLAATSTTSEQKALTATPSLGKRVVWWLVLLVPHAGILGFSAFVGNGEAAAETAG